MKWLIYNLLFTLAYWVMMPSFLLRMKRRSGYAARMGDRFGRYPKDIVFPENAIWIHAVSVGEVAVAGQLMREMRAQDSSIRFVFSTTSSTGWHQAEALVGEKDVLIYNPLDFLGCVRKALRQIRPRAVILTETEIWPNFIRTLKKCGVPIYLVNARVSDRSAPRYKALRFWFGEVLRCFTRIYAQSDLDASRLIAAGALPKSVVVTGSFKFDVAKRNPSKEKELRAWIGAGEILLGGSTWPGEDCVLLRAYQRILTTHPTLKLVLAPRHFEKADAVEENIKSAGFASIRRSRHDAPTTESPAVYLADTTGELMGLFGIATVAFVGKSLCAHGSQNMIEPCLCGVPTVVGPYTENFRPVMSDLLAANALVQTPDSKDEATREESVIKAIEELFADEAARSALGARATKAVERRRGATEHCAAELLASIPTTSSENSFPKRSRSFRKLLILGLAFIILSLSISPLLTARWRRFTLNPNRSCASLVGLSLATAFCPTAWPAAHSSWEFLAHHNIPKTDEDGVARFKPTRLLKTLIPLIEGNVAHACIDTRLMPMARLKKCLSDFEAEHGAYRLWCIGQYDFVVTALPKNRKSGKAVKTFLVDDILEFFEDAEAFEHFAEAGIYAPADLFACYVGSSDFIAPAFANYPAWGKLRGALGALRLMCAPTPTNDYAAVHASWLVPLDTPPLDWLKPGTVNKDIYATFTNRVRCVQEARRALLLGFDEAAVGNSTNAIARWSWAAEVNPKDPLLAGLADSLDLEGRRRLKLGDVNGALNCYRNRIEVFPNDISAIHNFGICLKKSGHPEPAAQVFLTAAKKDPANDVHLLEFTECAAASGHEEDALKVMENLVKRRPDDATLKRRMMKIKAALLRRNVRDNWSGK